MRYGLKVASLSTSKVEATQSENAVDVKKMIIALILQSVNSQYILKDIIIEAYMFVPTQARTTFVLEFLSWSACFVLASIIYPIHLA